MILSVLEELQTTRTRLLSVLEGLTNDQINWKPDTATWSISQVVQHIAMVEAGSSHTITLGLAQEPNFVPSRIPLERLIPDRSKKVNAPERLHPSDEAKTLEQLMEALQTSRVKLVDTLNDIKDIDLLEKTSPPMPHPVFGQMSTGQWIAAMSLHEMRHIKQIEELKEHLLTR